MLRSITLQSMIVSAFAMCLLSTAQAQTSRHVDDDNCPGPGTGTCADPFCSIQAAIDASANGDEIIVEPGTYSETINFNGKAITLRSACGPDVTTVDGTGLNDSVVKCVSGEGLDTVLEGFTITGGTGDGGLKGGGMFNNNASSPTVMNCTFVGNTARDGGGMYNRLNSSPMVIGCRFIANIVTGPTASAGGGMHSANGSSPTVKNCTFRENSAQDMGGGIYSYNNNPLVINCTFIGNTAERGAGLSNQETSGNPILTNCTFKENTASLDGGGMYNLASSPLVRNCVLWGNSDGNGMGETAQIDDDASSASAISHSCIQGCTTFCTDPNGCNIADDPQYADSDGRLAGGSPCIDAGDNSVVDWETDLDGNPRFVDSPCTPDCQHCPDPAVCGDAPVVDMGAYEFQAPPDADCDGTADVEDACPDTPPGVAVDCHGRPRLDLNDDCVVNGQDLELIVEQFLN